MRKMKDTESMDLIVIKYERFTFRSGTNDAIHMREDASISRMFYAKGPI